MPANLMKGNEALAEGAVRAGCRFFAGYPITPQSEIAHYLSKRLPETGGVFIQAESETAAINMIYGAAGAGARALTASSSPGISLKQEGISYLAAAELPCVIANIARGGPGLGGIQPAQSDYFQATKGGGHGDYRLIVLAPASAQEMFSLTVRAFNLADRYRIPVLILSDGILGQMMEPVVLDNSPGPETFAKNWATTGMMGQRGPNSIYTLYLDPEQLERHNIHLQAKYRLIVQSETEAVMEQVQDADVLLVAYGIAARIAKAAVKQTRRLGIKTGLIRPITLWPFPSQAIFGAARANTRLLVIELSAGQMVEDVRLAAPAGTPVHFHGRTGGMVPSVDEIVTVIRKLADIGDDIDESFTAVVD